MQTTFTLAALAAVAYAAPQGVTGNISPSAPAPAGCSASHAGSFQISAVNSKVTKRDLYKRACGDPGSLVITLTDGKLQDAKGRTGYIAANYQFQFDAPPQAGAIYTDGFSSCNNGSLALGGSNVFYECLSGNFYNLYDRQWAPHCEPILIDLLPCGSGSNPVGQGSDGQPTGTAIGTVTEISDGQPQAPTAPPVTEISDGQPQAPTAPGGPVVTEISDGQPQAPTGSAAPVPISQISDGQPQAPTGSAAPVPISQISDGQPQAPSPTGSVAPYPATTLPGASVGTGTPTQLPGGSVASTAPIFTSTSTSTPGSPSPSPVTGNGNAVKGSMGLGVVAMVAAAFL